ncbi:rRNA maturation RNase YbeY [Haoranjiania flava]|uniref:Endoribonuclease YbeY n=1 Tax=Haoranjiania flava TaxID=1856322 RepID=A0AAE3IM20_9BACT|nr:rRNA maturation RNase YbeY [Haoranjiania flava]MCU7693516.1 rRNA maturation RNase YbeY [Haoranjiania flava]
MQKIKFNYADRQLNIKGKKEIQAFIPKVFTDENKKLKQVNYIFCSDNYLLDINKKHLNHNYYTDIITFDLSEDDNITAEIYISIDRVKENAEVLDVPFFNECLRVIIHGALHLCGYKDKTAHQKLVMRDMEDQYMDEFLQNKR